MYFFQCGNANIVCAVCSKSLNVKSFSNMFLKKVILYTCMHGRHIIIFIQVPIVYNNIIHLPHKLLCNLKAYLIHTYTCRNPPKVQGMGVGG